MAFSKEQLNALAAPLDPKLVKIKPTPGSPKYLEGHEAIAAANRIFGYSGWGYSVDRIDHMDAPGGVMYSALVSVTVEGCHTKQDIGTEVASNTKDGKPPSVQSHETAMKGAVTDGIKRALRSFGDQFGASLYDKDADLNAEYGVWKREQDDAAATQETEDQARTRLALAILDACTAHGIDRPTKDMQSWMLLGRGLGLPDFSGKPTVEYLEQVLARLERIKPAPAPALTPAPVTTTAVSTSQPTHAVQASLTAVTAPEQNGTPKQVQMYQRIRQNINEAPDEDAVENIRLDALDARDDGQITAVHYSAIAAYCAEIATELARLATV